MEFVFVWQCDILPLNFNELLYEKMLFPNALLKI
jgi:hypothetical protein